MLFDRIYIGTIQQWSTKFACKHANSIFSNFYVLTHCHIDFCIKLWRIKYKDKKKPNVLLKPLLLNVVLLYIICFVRYIGM